MSAMRYGSARNSRSFRDNKKYHIMLSSDFPVQHRARKETDNLSLEITEPVHLVEEFYQ
jgi:hypothetical protein